MIFAFSNYQPKKIGNRKLLVLDEGHQIENQLIEHVGISVTKKTLQKYISTDLLEYTKFTYDDNLETTWLKLLGNLYSEIEKSIEDISASEINSAEIWFSQFFSTLKLISVYRLDRATCHRLYTRKNEGFMRYANWEIRHANALKSLYRKKCESKSTCTVLLLIVLL